MKGKKKDNICNSKRLRLKSKYRLHIGYKLRLILSILFFIISFSFCIFFVNKSFDYRYPKVVNFNVNSSIDYKVKVKPNEFYENEYLDKNMIYVASLIDKINLDFNYVFTIDEASSLDFDYQIKADLIIANERRTTNYFKKTYVLSDSKHKEMNNDKKYNLKETIEIDYDYYNRLANDFKTSYGIDTSSYLNVYLEVNKTSTDNILKINDKATSAIDIPLSERSIEIKFDSKDTVAMKQAIADEEIIFHSKILVMEIILFIFSCIFISKIIKLLSLLVKKKNAYDVFLKKILKEYDRLIVETTTGIDKNSNIIKIEKFNELLDVRDNLKLPIMYYNIVSHQKCYFYIKNKEDIYLMYLKASDME